MSGRDRRHYVQQLKAAEIAHAALAKRVPEAQTVADEYQLMADRLVCEEWSVRQFIGGDIEPSPSIEVAVRCGYTELEIHCANCTHAGTVDLSEVIWPKRKGVHTMRQALACRRCSEGGRKFRPNLVGLHMLATDDSQPQARAMKKK